MCKRHNRIDSALKSKKESYRVTQLRQKLREGTIPAPEKFGTYSIGWQDGLDPEQISGMPESVKWWISCLGFLRSLFVDDRLSDNDAHICRTIIEGWHNKNSLNRDLDTRYWDGHAVALRTIVLVDVFHKHKDNSYLESILWDHLHFLADDKNFQGNWNHGIDQAHALLIAANHLECEQSKDIALSRLAAALNTIVDDDGVTIEQAIHYQLYNLTQIGIAIDLVSGMENGKTLVHSLLKRRELMKTFLAHATKPDGKYVEIGDTPPQLAESLPNSDAEYAATLGAQGVPPVETVRVYNGGYVFGRSGWGEARPFSEESHYSLRFGPPRIIHGHNDHGSITYFRQGVDILRDGGFHGYTNDDIRFYLRLAEAHNTVTILEPKLKFIGRESPLVERQVDGTRQLFRIVLKQYDGVTHTRTVVFVREPEAIVVVDTVESEKTVTAQQRWHFGERLRLSRTSDGLVQANDGFVEIRQHYPYDALKVFNPEDLENPSVVASDKLYETNKSPLIVTERTGQEISFLTTFSFSSPGGGQVTFEERKVASNGIRRSLLLRSDTASQRILFLEGGRIICG